LALIYAHQLPENTPHCPLDAARVDVTACFKSIQTLSEVSVGHFTLTKDLLQEIGGSELSVVSWERVESLTADRPVNSGGKFHGGGI